MIYLKTSVGIELRGEDMLVAALQSNFSSGVFTHFMRIPGYRLRDPEELRREVNWFFKSRGLSKENVVLGIPRKDIVLRYLDLPAEVSDNLKQVVQYQVQSFEPTEEDKYYHDYTVLRGAGAGKRLSILLVMVRRATMDEALQLLLGLGIKPVAVTGSSIGLSNLFLQNIKEHRDKTFILADAGAFWLETVALRNGSLVYSREVPAGAETVWKDMILSETSEAASKIRLGPDGDVEKIVLAGESSELACAEVKAAVPDCELIQNCIGVEIPAETKAHVQEAASALGLAYTGMFRRPSMRMNLLPPERRVHQSRWAYVPAAILGLIILALLCGLGFHTMAQNRALARRLDHEIELLKTSVARVMSFRSQSEELEKRTKAVEELLSARDQNLEVLHELTTILPADTFLSTYRYQEGNIQVSGQSGSASDLVPKLEKSPLLKDVVVKGTLYRNNQTGKEQFSFEMKLEK